MLLDFLLHPDKALLGLAVELGPWLYVLVFLIIFSETGLVVAPFLPGDSFLFALGSLTALASGDSGSVLSLSLLSAVLISATFLGDNTNYFIGKKIGIYLFTNDSSRLFNKKYLLNAQVFYARHGKKAIVLARFVPVARTFVPFVAGMASVPYRTYIFYSVAGALLWTQSLLWMGHYFGQIEYVKNNYYLVIIFILFLSILPALLAWAGSIPALINRK